MSLLTSMNPRGVINIINNIIIIQLLSIRDEYVAVIPEEERGDMVKAYHAQLNSPDEEVSRRAARAWSKWE